MPKRNATRDTHKRPRKQDILDTFFGGSSSPPRPERLPASGSRRSRRGRTSDPAVAKKVVPALDEDGSQSSDVGAIHFETAPATTTEEDDLKSSPRRPTKKRMLRKKRADSDEENDPQQSSEEETGVPTTWKRSSKAAGKRREAVVVGDEDEEEVQPRKRKLVRGQRPPSPEEDKDDLLGEVDEHRIISSRLRSRDTKTAFQKNLERLQRKKRGQPVASTSTSADDDDDDEVDDAPFADARPGKSGKRDTTPDEDGDTEEDDAFIVEDDNAAAPELPAEFSMNTFQDLLHHFKIICQFFVHLAVHEPDEREDIRADLVKNQYFAVPLQIARRKLLGMRDSLVTSSVWRTDYKKSLETYPDFEVYELDFAVHGCDACHLGSRMSTRVGRLSGLPYEPETFETFGEQENSEEDDDEDAEHGRRHKKEFNLGRFCAARTRVFHRFSHWEYALFRVLSQEVDELRTGAGARGFPPDDLSDADGIMDWLDQRGIINIEWQKVKDMMESARNLEMKAKKGEDDD
ncbi:uncharacterized protein B0H18DRAFT_1094787 [Fomitopsis serialis]|uniref:uncharacterized protein n=1 Tax=Fomitopsis serialis TaxID=139415 RepID=UPI002007DEF2|nr:uncharacterized protein B0H18DRAFT_1094787 [Neoantrodia serialis]KAH9926204.1 hypothetical protein B0H18DRAFT_1094787 [Neoantrodia serialis]